MGVTGYRFVLALSAIILVLTACTTQEKPSTEKKDYSRPLPPGASALELVTDPSLYPDFRAMYPDRRAASKALDESLTWFSKPSSKTHYPSQGFSHERARLSVGRLKDIIDSAHSASEMSGFIAREFEVWRSVGWDGQGGVLFTGYCQPIFQGSRTQTARFTVPLYGLPNDLVKADDGTPQGRRTEAGVVPYFTRAEIDGGGILDNSDLELVWLASKLDAYVVHVQGSAQIELTDGQTMYIGYAGKTDRPYSSLGKALADEGKMEPQDVSLASIRRYFDENPQDLDGYLHRNESYVFFGEYPPGGPYGSLGVAVTPLASLATDKSIFPRGVPCAVETTLPRIHSSGVRTRPFVALAVDQDTGGAIRSAGRCDIFIGIGPEAETIAGYTKQEGQLYYLLLKEEFVRSEE